MFQKIFIILFVVLFSTLFLFSQDENTGDEAFTFFILKGLKNGSVVYVDNNEVEAIENKNKFKWKLGEHTILIIKKGYDQTEKDIVLEKNKVLEIEISYKFDKEKFMKSYKPIGIGLTSIAGTMLITGLPLFVLSLTDYFAYQYDEDIRNRQLGFFLAGVALEIGGLTLMGMSIPLFVMKKERKENNNITNPRFSLNLCYNSGLDLGFSLRF